MLLTLPPGDLAKYLARQIANFFPDSEIGAKELQDSTDRALERLEYCLVRIKNKYALTDSGVRFNHRNTDQYAMFLYLVANSIFRAGGDLSLAEKVYALNKALHGLDVFYEVELPNVFCFQHPVGTVLGRANYSNFFFVYQRCTVGAKDGIYPRLGEGVVIYGGGVVIGDCTVGANVWVSAGTLILGQEIPPNSVVFGSSPQLTIKTTTRNVIRDLFFN